jgi:predicted transcriptional regulator
MSDKEMAAAVLDKMPQTATLDEISEELAILAAIQRGKADIAAGRTITHEDVKQRSATWHSK